MPHSQSRTNEIWWVVWRPKNSLPDHQSQSNCPQSTLSPSVNDAPASGASLALILYLRPPKIPLATPFANSFRLSSVNARWMAFYFRENKKNFSVSFTNFLHFLFRSLSKLVQLNNNSTPSADVYRISWEKVVSHLHLPFVLLGVLI